ncbi:MAG: class I SAM-dependent methyltransferase [Alphaproteobacteria bacterium]|nr:class I SAM-dependent methyltransferase [Alphaproteobacteria bacterium]
MAGSTEAGKLYTALAVRKMYDEGIVRRVLDIGAGSGTYSNLLRAHMPGSEWHAVEIWEPYVTEYDLASKYDHVHCVDARLCDPGKLASQFDLVFCGDVLEHMEKEDAQKLIDRLLSVSKLILISIPIVHYPQGEEHGNPYEAHVKDDWSHDEVIDSFPNIATFFLQEGIGLYILSTVPELNEPLVRLNAALGDMIRKQMPEKG